MKQMIRGSIVEPEIQAMVIEHGYCFQVECDDIEFVVISDSLPEIMAEHRIANRTKEIQCLSPIRSSDYLCAV